MRQRLSALSSRSGRHLAGIWASFGIVVLRAFVRSAIFTSRPAVAMSRSAVSSW